jgi:Mrp family chromosome partitioning ATPase
MGHLLMALSRSFDLVIVDTPADNSGGAARMIASRAGTSLLLVRANRTSRTAVVKLADQLQQLGASVVGVALNHA